MERRSSAIIETIAGLLALSVVLLATECLAEDRSLKIKVIATGKASGMSILTAWFTTEPSTDPIVIPTRSWGAVTPSDIRRFMRIYFPRTYDELLDYEFFFLAQVDMNFLTAKQQRWIYDALSDYEKGAVNTRSVMSALSWFNTPWRDSILSRAFPNDVDAVLADYSDFQGKSGPLIIRDDPKLPKIMSPYKKMIEPIFSSYGGLNTIPKTGSTILSYTKNNEGVGYPVPGQIAHVFYWHWNKSITFTFKDMIYDSFWTGGLNPYALDIIANIAWFSTGRKLPQDPLKVHDFRRNLFNYNIQKSLLTSLLDFAESFGANPSKIYSKLSETDATKKKASDQYLERDFNSAYDTVKVALNQLKALEDEAAKLKDRALFWVYVVEWSVTTGVLLVAGVVLWSLMVRRRLYREVSSTKWSG